jgi:hypothetical protein
LNRFQQLRALRDRIIVCEKDLEVDAALTRNLPGSTCVLPLVGVLLHQQRHEKFQFWHTAAFLDHLSDMCAEIFREFYHRN